MSRRIKNTISNKELLQAMGGIRDCYVKEADYAACAVTKKQPHRWYVAAGMAAMLALSILLPNLNKTTAYAMQSLPVIGEYFKLVTFREYRFDDGRHSADVKWNKIYADKAGMDDSEKTGKQAHKSVKEINAQMEQKTEKLLKEFKKQVGALGYSSLTVDSKVVTNSSKYYCVMLSAFSSQADGYQADAFYTIEKSTGNLLELSNLFPENADYVDVLTAQIKKQMRQNMKKDENNVYFLDTDTPAALFDKIDENQQFYINGKDEIVICFAEGDVAPASMGTLHFVIPQKVVKELQKNE